MYIHEGNFETNYIFLISHANFEEKNTVQVQLINETERSLIIYTYPAKEAT